ncbi:type VI secretion system baseplate subunit TssG [Trinickia sp. EG282A]|uniref:type VI secretion system baseplate subunit TssG n=1 Tax=Trinickia sp. EG282A TaxID=3237013 RepID=UPI0034D38D0E
MATDAGQPARSVAERLFAEPHAFEFVQAIRLIELLRPDAVSPGTGLDPRAEAVGLNGTLSPVFAPSALGPLRRTARRALAAADNGERAASQPQPQLQVNGFALGGPDGPLPDTYQEWLQDRLRKKDTSAAAFLDLFQHRLIALLYRAKRKFRIADPYREPRKGPADVILRGIAGLQLGARRQAVPAPGLDVDAVLARAGLFANRRRSVAGFDVLAAHHFGINVRTAPFAGGWRALPDESTTRIGRAGRNHWLGAGAVAGTRIWDEHRGVRISLGPLTLAQYEAYLPGGRRHAELRALAAAYFGAELYLHIEVHLARGEQPRARLSSERPLRLGWTAWAGTGETSPARIAHVTIAGGAGARP